MFFLKKRISSITKINFYTLAAKVCIWKKIWCHDQQAITVTNNNNSLCLHVDACVFDAGLTPWRISNHWICNSCILAAVCVSTAKLWPCRRTPQLPVSKHNISHELIPAVMATSTSQTQPVPSHISHTEALGSNCRFETQGGGSRRQSPGRSCATAGPPEFNYWEPFQPHCFFPLLRRKTLWSFPRIIEKEWKNSFLALSEPQHTFQTLGTHSQCRYNN